MNQIRNLPHPSDSARNIRYMRTANQPRLVRKQRTQLIDVAQWIRRTACTPPFDGEAESVGNSLPWSSIGLVIELGKDHLISRLEL